jgi:hypothetical protein
MRFIVGALALAVLGVLVGTPAAFVLGYAPLSGMGRLGADANAEDGTASASKPGETGVTVRPKGRFS